MKTYKLFVIYHDKIDLTFFEGIDLDRFCFVNVNPRNPHVYPQLPVLNLHELPGFIGLGKWYTESEVIYNVYKHPVLTQGVDYVGFVHYDIDFSGLDGATLEAFLDDYELVNFQPYSFRADFNQRILMDEKRPDTLQGAGRNCYVSIFADFNRFYGTAHSFPDFMNSEINLCACFLMRKDRFEEMMVFASEIIESGKLNGFDRHHKYRIQGGFMERYYGVWCLLKMPNAMRLPLKHVFVETRRQQSFLSRFKAFIIGRSKTKNSTGND